MSHWSYLPFLLVWALPVVAFEWLVGARSLWRDRGIWLWIVLALTVWFTFADAVALHAGIWRFDTSELIGLYLGPVPIEEILFYLLTSLMVVQGYVLFRAGLARRLTRRARHVRWFSRTDTTSSTTSSPLDRPHVTTCALDPELSSHPDIGAEPASPAGASDAPLPPA